MSISTKNIPEGQKATPLVGNVTSEKSWSINSSDGRSYFSCHFINKSEKSESLICRIIINRFFWRRGKLHTSSETTNDFSISLDQVLINPFLLKKPKKHLEEWKNNKNNLSVNLTKHQESDQILSISIDRDTEYIYTKEKPAYIINYKCGASIQGRWSFIIDQSCISLCIESIDIFLKLIDTKYQNQP